MHLHIVTSALIHSVCCTHDTMRKSQNHLNHYIDQLQQIASSNTSLTTNSLQNETDVVRQKQGNSLPF